MPYNHSRPRTRMSGPEALIILIWLLSTLIGFGSLIAWAAGADRFLIIAAIMGIIATFAMAGWKITSGGRPQ
ncbi:hypothetical protein [Nesterenkonia suensis]